MSALVRNTRNCQNDKTQNPSTSHKQNTEYISQPKLIKPRININDVPPEDKYATRSGKGISQNQSSYKNLYALRNEPKIESQPHPKMQNLRPSLIPSKPPNIEFTEPKILNKSPIPVSTPLRVVPSAPKPPSPMVKTDYSTKTDKNVNSQLKQNTKPEPNCQTTALKILEDKNIIHPTVFQRLGDAKNAPIDYLSKLEEKYQPISKLNFQQQIDPGFEELEVIVKKENETNAEKKIIDVEITKFDDPYKKALEIIEAKNLNFIHYDRIVESIKAFQKSK